MAGEKTEKATPKRKKDERKKGNIFMSQDVVTILSLLSAFFALKLLSPYITSTLNNTIIKYLKMLPTMEAITEKDLGRILLDGCIIFAQTAMPLLLICVLIAVVSTMFQTKMLFSAKAFAFKGERINPLNGLKKMLSMRSLVELLKSILKICILGYIIYSSGSEQIALMPRLTDMSFSQFLQYTMQIIFDVVIKASIVFIFLAGADYLYQWWEYEKNLRMSKQEIKDEYKQVEGDPLIKSKQRSIQQQRSRQRMMQSVPEADVIIRNPTHYAVALKYDQEKNRAPIVVAKGANEVALRIIAIAQENDIFMTENRPLARALFESAEINQEIPEKYFKAVAEILAFMYALRERK